MTGEILRRTDLSPDTLQEIDKREKKRQRKGFKVDFKIRCICDELPSVREFSHTVVRLVRERNVLIFNHLNHTGVNAQVAAILYSLL